MLSTDEFRKILDGAYDTTIDLVVGENCISYAVERGEDLDGFTIDRDVLAHTIYVATAIQPVELREKLVAELASSNQGLTRSAGLADATATSIERLHQLGVDPSTVLRDTHSAARTELRVGIDPHAIASLLLEHQKDIYHTIRQRVCNTVQRINAVIIEHVAGPLQRLKDTAGDVRRRGIRGLVQPIKDTFKRALGIRNFIKDAIEFVGADFVHRAVLAVGHAVPMLGAVIGVLTVAFVGAEVWCYGFQTGA